MATKTSFKQQCPSCEAMVPIKDRSLIGRKIDCPKCKYRFVVEGPEDEEPEAAEATKPAAKGKGKEPAKGGPRKRRADDNGKSKKKKKAGGSNKVVLGAGLAVVAVILLGVAGFFMMGGSDSGSGTP